MKVLVIEDKIFHDTIIRIYRWDRDAHVYCTECKHFSMDNDCNAHCPFEDKCDIWDFEDSRAYRDRPYWKPKVAMLDI